ncbi:hypothetical protein COW36_14140 [bacterium (Candidatus Blackallbacteria) CG17_big_fil_post_rev_8_21_14_2_50_48_46]|uniref:Toxin-antitoxin system HicB family antitoxin n=1 Tax=bacterium (Candidatus Blackallbacteria) CG17_big_fil_post_rev_8_21_14_2_50_48_46 TaxID=2014261 RepID=A0A2M7G382_9BACT|nr:MAG: hypothetical protein COW64_23610 [bacterium (Candidatus Blackallbacteria) CG18_big_fil_WC_8_21_14_2_50_49_26]PIW16279.1 MAG: hypothetical protein COW36_14140 [bacterium (Candidatus Blackallbacteria) CG17_big_fil_post_rev_8_21_14_2_50_48_46]PIW49942.1 MAG: hypothetical protein COW20_04165 [bacterium (Candidatus Blackallbacteria) CG13_big_fil_rev_8_21_14_2_50_49_14]
MAAKKQFLLRIDPKLFLLLEQWATDEFRSVNGQLEFLLRDALKRSGRLKAEPGSEAEKSSEA